MARLNITIPNSLAEELEAFRGVINASEVCTLALRQEVTRMRSLADQTMSYSQERQEEWIRWFLDPSTTDEQELAASLRSVPGGQDWNWVEARLRVALHEERMKLVPSARAYDEPGQGIQYHYTTETEMQQWRLLEAKERLFYAERRIRGLGRVLQDRAHIVARPRGWKLPGDEPAAQNEG